VSAGPVDQRDAHWCWAFANAVLFDTTAAPADSVTGYLRSMVESYDDQYRDALAESGNATVPAAHRAAAVRLAAIAAGHRDAYADALRVIEGATDSADRIATAAYG